jgi:hypothetical protein
MKLFSFLSKEKREVPVIYQIGWWAHQEILQVTSFEVEIVKSNLNLFNSISLIRYTVKGTLNHQGGSIPYIRAVHHSEQLVHAVSVFSDEDSDSIPVHANIQLTPIAAFKDLKKRVTGPVSFEFSNEYKIKSLRWGQNRFKFSCAGIERTIYLSQRK